MLKGGKPRPRHFRNAAFLKALGEHCRRLRIQKGYSIDRLAKEGEQLSSSVIHRLENGSGAVTVSALFRYAQGLGLSLRDLADFEWREPAPAGVPRLVALDDPRVAREEFRTLLPLYSLEAAAGVFGAGREVRPEGWIETGPPPGSAKGRDSWDRRTFVARAVGSSMLPRIRDGDFLVFRAHPEGSRQGRIVLAQYSGPADPDTGGSYTVKVYQSSKVASEGEAGWRHREVRLSPLNPDYEPITLRPGDEGDFRILAEYLFSL